MRISTFDLSVKRTGHASPDGVLSSITARNGSAEPHARLSELFRAFCQLLHHERPDLVVVEGYSFASPGRLSLVRLGEVGAACRLAAYEGCAQVMEVPPASLKKYATGASGASKAEMIDAAVALRYRPGKDNDDEADAALLHRMTLDAYSRTISVKHFDPAKAAIEALSWPTL